MAETKATTLVTLAAARAWLGATDGSEDARIVQVADGVSERVESYCARAFVTRTFDEFHNGSGTRQLLLRRYPVVTIASLTVKDSPTSTPTSLVQGTDYDIERTTGRIWMRARNLTKGFQNIEAGYDAGYGVKGDLALPQDIVQATLDYIKLVWTETTTNAISATSISVGPSSFVLKPGLPWGIKQALDNWHRSRL